ncbi:hypothetical protein ACFLSX_01315, partial [Calditrichota bacterium]
SILVRKSKNKKILRLFNSRKRLSGDNDVWCDDHFYCSYRTHFYKLRILDLIFFIQIRVTK